MEQAMQTNQGEKCSLEEPLEVAGFIARDWAEFCELAECNPSMVEYVLAHKANPPWPKLEQAQRICRAIVARHAAWEAM